MSISKKDIFKKPRFILILISFTLISILMIDIIISPKENEYFYNYAIMWIGNLFFCITYILNFNKSISIKDK